MKRPIALLLALTLLCLLAPVSVAQDTWKNVERIVAVGDVHGDFDQFVITLRAAKVINDKNDWTAGKTHLVQCGDVLDRGPDSRKAMDLLMKLEAQAAKAGGAVHALIGNHEAMVVMGDWRYVSQAEIDAFGGRRQYRDAMSAKGKYGKWLRSLNTVIKVNDILFVHAGLTPEVAKKSIAEINKTVRKELDNGDPRGLVNDPDGPIWTRKLALGDEDDIAPQLDQVLKLLKASHIVIGHTVETEGVITRADGRLIRIDVGMSACYGGPAACLVVEKGIFYEVRHPDKKRKLDIKTPAKKAPVPAN